jgi:CheY-like chemotaxis protein
MVKSDAFADTVQPDVDFEATQSMEKAAPASIDFDTAPPRGFDLPKLADLDTTQPLGADGRHPSGFEQTRPLDWEQQIIAPDYAEVIAAMESGEFDHPEPTDRKRVLIVDDDLPARLYLRAKLSLLDSVDVYEATTGDEALGITQNTRFDGILLDVNMQGTDGYGVCRAMKRNHRSMGGKQPKIYIVTSRSGMLERMRATLAGADAFMSKPPHPGQLTDLLASL